MSHLVAIKAFNRDDKRDFTSYIQKGTFGWVTVGTFFVVRKLTMKETLRATLWDIRRHDGHSRRILFVRYCFDYSPSHTYCTLFEDGKPSRLLSLCIITSIMLLLWLTDVTLR